MPTIEVNLVTPGSHIRDLVGPVEVSSRRGILLTWKWAVRNNGNRSAFIDTYIKYQHDRGGIFGARDETLFEYLPGEGVVYGRSGAGGITDSYRVKRFAEIGRIMVAPGRSVEVKPNAGLDITGSVLIPGPLRGPKALEWWKDNKDARFNITFALYLQKYHNERMGSANKIMEHYYPRLWEVAKDGW